MYVVSNVTTCEAEEYRPGPRDAELFPEPMDESKLFPL